MTTIQDKNKAIAEFMGFEMFYHVGELAKGNKVERWRDSNLDSKHFGTRSIDQMKYHTSWDWLMPVVQKFLNIPLEEFNYDAAGMSDLRLRKSLIESIPISTPIEVVHKELHEHIQWYNQQTTKEVEP